MEQTGNARCRRRCSNGGRELSARDVQALEFDHYGDDEAFRLGKLIEQDIEHDRPPELAELRFVTGLDHTGDPGLWIWVFLSDDVSKTDKAFLKAARRLDEYLNPIASEISRRFVPDRFPYLSFRPLAEQSMPVEAS